MNTLQVVILNDCRDCVRHSRAHTGNEQRFGPATPFWRDRPPAEIPKGQAPTPCRKTTRCSGRRRKMFITRSFGVPRSPSERARWAPRRAIPWAGFLPGTLPLPPDFEPPDVIANKSLRKQAASAVIHHPFVPDGLPTFKERVTF